MASLRIWIILSSIALPTVMFGGYSIWTKVTIAGAALLACAVCVQVYGLITTH